MLIMASSHAYSRCTATHRVQFPKSLFSYHSQDGWTALMSASQNGHLEIVEKLLAASAEPDLQDKVLAAKYYTT